MDAAPRTLEVEHRKVTAKLEAAERSGVGRPAEDADCSKLPRSSARKLEEAVYITAGDAAGYITAAVGMAAVNYGLLMTSSLATSCPAWTSVPHRPARFLEE
jgi:hypothetical protein